MGAGIAQAAASRGVSVTLIKATPGPVDAAKAGIEKSLARLVEKGKMEQADADAIMGRLSFTDDLGAAADADLVVFPGASGQPLETLGNGSVLAGLDAVILRREIRALATRDMPKKLDLLAYLHDETQRAATREFAENHGLIVHILDGFTTECPRLLAEARVFLSGYGQAFYEAAAVGTYPVAWPISDVHRTEAAAFYDATGIPPVVIQGKRDLPALLGPATAPPASRFFRLPDGTPNIVTRLASLFSSEEAHP